MKNTKSLITGYLPLYKADTVEGTLPYPFNFLYFVDILKEHMGFPVFDDFNRNNRPDAGKPDKLGKLCIIYI